MVVAREKFQIGDVVMLSEEGRRNFPRRVGHRASVVGYGRMPHLVRIVFDDSHRPGSWCASFWDVVAVARNDVPRPWTGEGSQTEGRILKALRKRRRLTRTQLAPYTGTQTCGLHLPKMVERGSIRIVPNTFPYVYELANHA